MAEKKKQAIQEVPKHDIQVKASVEEPSLLKELCKTAMEEYIVPRSTEMIRDMFGTMINMTSDMLRSCVDKILYPSGNVPNKRPTNSTGYYTGTTNYTSYSRPIGTYQSQTVRDTIGQRPGNAVKLIWVESEEKAKEICGALIEDIDMYGKAKVAGLYEIIHERTTMADFHYGWTDQHRNAIGYCYDSSRRSDENRWFIDLPKPVDITNI